jgi:hypothetical protein
MAQAAIAVQSNTKQADRIVRMQFSEIARSGRGDRKAGSAVILYSAHLRGFYRDDLRAVWQFVP